MNVAWEPATWSSYGSASNSFTAFCNSHNVVDPFPPSISTLLAWMVWTRNTQGIAAKSTGQYLSGIKSLCEMAGMDASACESAQVKFMLKGLKKTCPRRFRSCPRLPITIWVLAEFMAHLSESHNDVVLGAALAVGVQGLLRASEFVSKSGYYSLDRDHVQWFEDRVVLNIKSKTDYENKGFNVTLWRNNSSCCPWTGLKKVWEMAPHKQGFAPLFQNADGSAFSYSQLHDGIRRLALAAGLDPDWFKTHSCRMGGATTLAILGYPAHVIQRMGRWKSLSYQLYSHTSVAQLKDIGIEFGVHSKTGDRFGGLSSERAGCLDWDDFTNTSLFNNRPDGATAVSWK
jgi:hypothetical protein